MLQNRGNTMNSRTFNLLAAGVVLLALAIRLYYVLTVQVVNPLGGDAAEYVRYAQSLLHGYFGAGGVSDAYRSPGYPFTVAAAMLVGGDAWPRYLLVAQAFMGAATVGLTIALARQWMPVWAALAAGLVLTFWPHHIAFTAEVLGEVELGLCLTGALLLTVLAAFDKSDKEPGAVTQDYRAPSLARAEWEHINRVLSDCAGNISEAARRLGVHRRSLQRKLQKHPPNE